MPCLDELTVSSAHGAARALLSDDIRRWAHVQAVAAKAAEAARALGPAEGELLVLTAWLHDVGYAEPLVATGFHSLDGAQWLRQQGHERVACLVAHHSCASFEAALRGLSEIMATYPDEGVKSIEVVYDSHRVMLPAVRPSRPAW